MVDGRRPHRLGDAPSRHGHDACGPRSANNSNNAASMAGAGMMIVRALMPLSATSKIALVSWIVADIPHRPDPELGRKIVGVAAHEVIGATMSERRAATASAADGFDQLPNASMRLTEHGIGKSALNASEAQLSIPEGSWVTFSSACPSARPIESARRSPRKDLQSTVFLVRLCRR